MDTQEMKAYFGDAEFFAQGIEAAAESYSDLLDHFGDAAGFGFRTNSAGEYESTFVYLTFGPTATFDSATGEVCAFNTTATISASANRAVNEFFSSVFNC